MPIKNFIWSHNNINIGIHLINWNTIIYPRNQDGLLVKDLSIMTTAINCKHIIDIMNTYDTLWIKVCLEKIW